MIPMCAGVCVCVLCMGKICFEIWSCIIPVCYIACWFARYATFLFLLWLWLLLSLKSLVATANNINQRKYEIGGIIVWPTDDIALFNNSEWIVVFFFLFVVVAFVFLLFNGWEEYLFCSISFTIWIGYMTDDWKQALISDFDSHCQTKYWAWSLFKHCNRCLK